MRRAEIDALLSAGVTAERVGRRDDAKACAKALIQALRAARDERHVDLGGTRTADLDAPRWATNIVQGTASGTPV